MTTNVVIKTPIPAKNGEITSGSLRVPLGG